VTKREYGVIEAISSELSGLSVETWRLSLSQILHRHFSIEETRLLMREYNRLMIEFSTIHAGEKVH
jgi:hypothetical protein